MTADEVIAALSALNEHARRLPLVCTPPKYALPEEVAMVRYIPAPDDDGFSLVAFGPVVMFVTASQEEQEMKELPDKGPRVTPADIEANISEEIYFTAADGVIGKGGEVAHNSPIRLLTFCVLVLKNGFTVTGQSACVSPENFDAEIGRDIAYKDAISKLWPLMGYALADQLASIGPVV